jgi:hypothetical protein
MNIEDVPDFGALAGRELDLAAATTDKAAKTLHLNAAARYATLSERAIAPHKPIDVA